MKLVTFSTNSYQRAGCIIKIEDIESSVLDLSVALEAASDGLPLDVPSLLRRGQAGLDETAAAIDEVQKDPERARAIGHLHSLADVALNCPVGPKPFVLCAGANYADHLAEMNDFPIPMSPLWFVKSPHSVVGPNHNIELPVDHSTMVDFEGELAVVIGKSCHRVDAANALDFVAGYTILNDLSARDWVDRALSETEPGAVRLSWGLNIAGKQFPTFCPIGPALLTAEEVDDWQGLELTTRVNGITMQHAYARDMLFSIPKLIEHLSHFFSLGPGDVVSTGSPAGVGVSRDPRFFLSPGDTISITVEGIGSLENTVS